MLRRELLAHRTRQTAQVLAQDRQAQAKYATGEGNK
jgi:hypothetical protein